MDENEANINTTAFLFGNIDRRGQLEAEDADLVAINRLSDCGLEEIKSTIDSLFSQSSEVNNDYLEEGKERKVDQVVPIDFYDEMEYIDDTCFNELIDTQKIENNYRNDDDYDNCSTTESIENAVNKMPPPSEVPSNIHSKRNNQDKLHYSNQPNYQIDVSTHLTQNENINTLNTPLGSILPPEYATINIQTLFPHFHPEKIPRWSKLFKAFHEPKLYGPLDQWKLNPPENVFVNHENENHNYVYDDYGMNLGIMPPDDMILPNDADHFSLSAKSFEDCEVPIPFRDIQPFSDSNNLTQLNHISQRSEATNNFQKRTKFQQDLKRKRKRDDKLNRFKGNGALETNIPKSEVLTGLTWRDGPSVYWYDMYNVPIDENILEYRIKPSILSDDENMISILKPDMLKDEDCSFSTWQLVFWEGDIIIEPQTVKNQILESNKKYACHAGWIPSIKHRNMATFQDAACSDYFGIWPASSTGTLVTGPDVSQWHSIFALENSQMSEADWVTKVIVDPRHQNAQEAYLLELDLNNECIHFDFTNPQQTKEILTSELNSVYLTCPNQSQQPTVEVSGNENVDTPAVVPSNADTPNKEKQLKKLKILSKLSEVNETDEKPKECNIEPIESESLTLVQYCDRDTYVVVNDAVDKNAFFMDIVDNEVIETTETISPLMRHGIQHSLSAIQLDTTFFPLKLDNQFLRHMHRSQLADVKNPLIHLFLGRQPIYNLIDALKKESEQRQKISQLTGSGDLFLMRSITDLSASIDNIILAEYSEEYPPLMMQTGMASRIINYFHGHPNQPVVMPQLPYGELCISLQLPFLGQLSPNQIFQALENNMFRAPIYPHKLKSTDFLVIIKPKTICIRRVDDIFLVGQELPIIEVPAPNSKKANTFLKDFLQVQIIRMFLQSQSEPKRIRHEEIKAMFSEQSDSALKKRLKIFAEYKKADTGNNSGFWVLKPEFQLPTEDELIELITPEECCSYYSMMWGLCRLEDAGYNSKSFIQADPEQQDEDEEKESNLKIEDEVKAAPWHTTKTFLDAQKGKCYLELLGATEPSGCGEAFSYARVSAKGSLFKETLKNKMNKPTNTSGTHVPGVGKRMVTGTDADLRKLTLKKAYALLKECGISEHDFKKLKRWDIIDLVRQMSTQKANQGEEEAMIKFARSSKMTVAGQEERYKAECQRIFSLQNQVLANEDELTSDDGASEDDEENCDDIRKSLYNALDNRMGVNDDEMVLFKIKKSFEKRSDILSETNSVADGDNSGKSYTCVATADNARAILKFKAPVPKAIPKALCIRRQVDNTVHCQTIPWSTIVKIYFRMNQEHKSEYLRNFCGLNHSKEEEKKARRKQQDKIRRLKRQQKQKSHITLGHGSTLDSNNVVKKKYRPKVLTSVQLKSKMQTTESLANINCGACGKKGHMRTNKECPQYGKSVKKAFAKRQLLRPLSKQPQNSKTIYELLNPDKEPLAPPIPRDVNYTELPLNDDECRLSAPDSVNEQIIADEDIDLNNMNDPTTVSVLSTVNDDQDSSGLKLVIPKQLIAHYSSSSTANISQSLDFKNRNKSKKFNKNKEIMELGNNKRQFSSLNKKISMNKLIPGNTIMTGAKPNEYVLEQKMRGNRRRIDPRVALNHQFEEIYKGLLQVVGYRCFLHPVRKRECPSYYSVIENPMDLSTVKMKINKNYYETRESFLQDIKLIYDNCIRFNGESNEYTIIAKQLMSHVMEQFCAKERKLMRLERLVNPLMDEDDMVGMRYILEQTVSAMEEVEHSRPFHIPVDKKKYPDYLDRIPKPMDLFTLRTNIKSDKYKSREDFLTDAELILINCIAYNGENSLLTVISRKLIEVANQIFSAKESTFNTLEANLKIQFDDASDSQIAASSCMTDHLSHMGEDHMEEDHLEEDHMEEDLYLEFDDHPSCIKRQRLNESYEEDKAGSISTGASADANRERIMADLQLTDSDDDDGGHGSVEHNIRTRSESDFGNIGFEYSTVRSRDHSTSLEDKSNLYHYQMSENDSDVQESPTRVTFYISDDD